MDVPDEWTITKIKSRKQLQRQQATEGAESLVGREDVADAQTTLIKAIGGTGVGRMSFFSRRAQMEAPAPSASGGAFGDLRPEGTGSVASSAAARRLARAQGRASDRGKPSLSSKMVANPLRGPSYRTLSELARQVDFDDEQKRAVLAMRAAMPAPPMGEAADPDLVSLVELKQLGFTPASLTTANFTPALLQGVGYTIADLVGDPNIGAAALKELGHGPAAMFDVGITATQMRGAGFSPIALRRDAGLSLPDLKAAGFTSKEFKEQGFSAAEFLQAGFAKRDIRLAGFKAESLFKKSKWSLADLCARPPARAASRQPQKGNVAAGRVPRVCPLICAVLCFRPCHA